MLLSRRVRALLLLTCQNATIALLTRQSRLGNTEELYLPSSAVLLAEVSVCTFVHERMADQLFSGWLAHIFLTDAPVFPAVP